MINIYYWSPFISNIATPKAVINSAISLEKYSKNKFKPTIISLFKEWDNFNYDIKKYNINILQLFSKKLNFNFPEKGFFQSRISFILISLISFFPLFFLLKKKKPNYFIIHLNTTLPLILLLLFNFDTKFILRISGKPKLHIIRKLLWKFAAKKLYKVTTPTNGIAEELINSQIFDKSKIHVLYDPVIHINKITRQKKNNKIDKNTFIAIGRLTRQKNFLFLIKSFNIILKRNDKLKLYILGEGDERDKIQNLINKYNLNTNIFLEGYQKNIDKYLKQAHCFILTSLWEDPGFVIIESAINNTLILSSNCETGPKEILKDKINSFVFKSNDVDSFIKKFNQMYFTNENKKFQMKVLMKKEIKKFTLFDHYNNLISLFK